jgi:hypothetical protein
MPSPLLVMPFPTHNENHTAKRAKKGGEKREKRLYLLGFCPNGDRNASDESGKYTAYALVLGHLIEIAENHEPGITIRVQQLPREV